MDVLFKIQLLLVAGTMGCTISAIISILAGVTPNPITYISLPLCWVLMIKRNLAWKMLWEKWTKK
ncbi:MULTISPECIES: hypothetical protein [Priestia]|uniref:hypothetical protein n=1 Tax=Priestia TaxID=2800373 RepID=UPI001C8D9CDF|nr:hypothetical protein [Priestia aryabhattai]MBY0210636.1 hypothetical protein [Priestia aryabhattai]